MEGLHLSAFDPKSISVNNSCLEEVNRLRSCYWKDLPLYEISVAKKPPVKRHLLTIQVPLKKTPMATKTSKPMKRCSIAINSDHPVKKCKVMTNDHDCEVVAIDRSVVPQYEWRHYRYYPVNEEWQRRACELLGIRFVCPFQWQDGGPHVILTRSDLRSLRFIGGDGNCMSYVISGSEEQHFEIWLAIVAHMLTVPHLVSGIGPDGNRNYLVTLLYTKNIGYMCTIHYTLIIAYQGRACVQPIIHLYNTPPPLKETWGGYCTTCSYNHCVCMYG